MLSESLSENSNHINCSTQELLWGKGLLIVTGCYVNSDVKNGLGDMCCLVGYCVGNC